MRNNHKFRTWEWLIVVWMFLSGLAHLLKLLDDPFVNLIDTHWFRLNQLLTGLAFLVMMHLRGRREKQESEQFNG